MSFTVVTVLHDSADALSALLASLDRCLPGGAQVVVVDTDSSDGGAEMAERWGAEAVDLGGNPGFGAANNAGLERARHPVSVLLNPDCELLDGSLGALVDAAGRERALLVPRLLGADGHPQRTAHPLPGTAGALLPALLPSPLLPAGVRLRAEPWRSRRSRTVGWAIAACLAARTDLLRSLGPFDPAQFLFYEDMDLCLRARAAGVPTVFVPDVVLRHSGGHSTSRAYRGEPHELLARRRREVVRANLGARAAALDGAAQAVTFATRWAGRAVLGRDRMRERDQLAAQMRITVRRCSHD